MEFSAVTKISFLLMVLLLLPLHNESASTSKISKRVPLKYTNFIKNKCNSTSYPYPCLKTLLPYASVVEANSTKLCTTSLKVAIEGVKNASVIIKDVKKQKGITVTESKILKDCIEEMKDAVYALKQTVGAMNRMGDKDRRDFEWDNAKTYGSAVITDVDSCLDGFSGRKVGATVKRKVKNVIYYVTQLSSNALFFIDTLY